MLPIAAFLLFVADPSGLSDAGQSPKSSAALQTNFRDAHARSVTCRLPDRNQRSINLQTHFEKMRDALIEAYPNESYSEIILIEHLEYCEDEQQWQVQGAAFSRSLRNLKRTMKAEGIEGEY